MYLPGDTILITDIGSSNAGDSDPGSSLVCVTTNVNTHCCRGADGGSRGEWLDPDETRILNSPNSNFYRTRYTHQVRLNNRNNAMSPTGVFTCVVPNDEDNTTNHNATITIGKYSKQKYFTVVPKRKIKSLNYPMTENIANWLTMSHIKERTLWC